MTIDSEFRDNRRSNFQEEDGRIPPELRQKFDAESQLIQKQRAASGIEDPVWDRRTCPICADSPLFMFGNAV